VFTGLTNEELLDLFISCYMEFVTTNNEASRLEANDCYAEILVRMVEGSDLAD
jgi:hypothetical protein